MAKANLDCKPNAPRHSFGTYQIRLTGDPAGVADEMGTSMLKIESHYRNRSQGVTIEQAKEYFSILPGGTGEIVPLPVPDAAKKENEAAAA
jgi:hypothetical protein